MVSRADHAHPRLRLAVSSHLTAWRRFGASTSTTTTPEDGLASGGIFHMLQNDAQQIMRMRQNRPAFFFSFLSLSRKKETKVCPAQHLPKMGLVLQVSGCAGAACCRNPT